MSEKIVAKVDSDSIVVDLVLKASVERVWSAITEEGEFVKWFCPKLTGKIAEGEVLTMEFDCEGSVQCFMIVEAMEPRTRFAYRWHPGEDCELDKYPRNEMTLVEFLLNEVDGGTRLVVKETGFSQLPKERYESSLKANTGGWEYEIAELRDYVEGA